MLQFRLEWAGSAPNVKVDLTFAQSSLLRTKMKSTKANLNKKFENEGESL